MSLLITGALAGVTLLVGSAWSDEKATVKDNSDGVESMCCQRADGYWNEARQTCVVRSDNERKFQVCVRMNRGEY